MRQPCQTRGFILINNAFKLKDFAASDLFSSSNPAPYSLGAHILTSLFSSTGSLPSCGVLDYLLIEVICFPLPALLHLMLFLFAVNSSCSCHGRPHPYVTVSSLGDN